MKNGKVGMKKAYFRVSERVHALEYRVYVGA